MPHILYLISMFIFIFSTEYEKRKRSAYVFLKILSAAGSREISFNLLFVAYVMNPEGYPFHSKSVSMICSKDKWNVGNVYGPVLPILSHDDINDQMSTFCPEGKLHICVEIFGMEQQEPSEQLKQPKQTKEDHDVLDCIVFYDTDAVDAEDS